ncbi:MAG: TldD/PmbA family protein, partial [Elainellaceae cyanobacterium]
ITAAPSSVGFAPRLEESFRHLSATLMDSLKPGEHLTITLVGEQSQFVRFNQAKVRQGGMVTDGTLDLTLMAQERTHSYAIPLTGQEQMDIALANQAIATLRQELPTLPIDPYQVLPSGSATSHDVHHGQLLAPEQAATAILSATGEVDFTGLYAGGTAVRGYADSAGRHHWFATESYTLDYSLFTPEGRAVKGVVAGDSWDDAAYRAKLQTSVQQLARLQRPTHTVARGDYRTYLAPAAVADLVAMLSWGGVSEASLRRGSSALAALQRGDKTLSDKLTLTENFTHGLVPRFNETGEIAPACLSLIEQGRLANTLVSSRTAKEYGVLANGAASHEGLRSPDMAAGTLSPSAVLQTLGTGLYLSNVHYLNWSDRPSGRITGMTRYACFWVENGELVAPIENLRFDESLYRFWGDKLLALTDSQEFIPEVGSYGNRDLGGSWMPGMLVDGFTYTL